MKSTGDSIANISGNGHRDINIKVNYIACSSVSISKKVENISLNWLPVANGFTGREDILEKIKEEFIETKYVVLHGIPGIGKTETARQFGNRNCGFFNGNLIWIFSETPDKIKECFDKLATSLDLKITDASLIFNQFKTSKALFVFDNAESMAAIKHYLPPNELHSTVHVLITSRLCNWGSSTSISKIPLNTLDRKDALSIFDQKLGDKFKEYELENWEELVQKLEGIPLCLQIVSSLIQQQVNRIRLTKFKLEDCIKELEVKFISSTISDSVQDYYQKSVLVAINSVLSRFEEAKAFSSLDLLCFVAYLDADRIYDDVLLLIPSIEKSKQQLEEEALNKVVDYSLIQIVKESGSPNMKIKVHRTVQLVLREYDLNQRKGEMLKTLLRLTLMSDKMSSHKYSILKHGNKKNFLEKAREFYNENESLIEEYVENLVKYYSHEALQIILPKFKNDRTEKFIQMLGYRVDFWKDFKTIKVFIKTVAQNEADVREIDTLSDWRSTKFICILLKSNIFKNEENVSEDQRNLKNWVTGRFLHSLVNNSNMENVRQTFKCIIYLTYKWGADILCQDDVLEDNILHAACRNEDISLKIIEYLFQLDNEKLKSIVNCQNKKKETPLHYLLFWNITNPDIFRIFHYFICECKADITIQDEKKRNILFYICWRGSFEMIEFLLRERDCSQIIYDQDKNGDFAFSKIFRNFAIKEADLIKLFDYILKNNVLNSSEKRNEIIKKMLYETVFDQYNNSEVIKLLIENSSICEKTWPSIELIDTLLQANFIENKISAANKFVHLLVYKSNKDNVKEIIDCIQYLISTLGADILYQNHYLNNILHKACLNRKISLEIIEYLFQLENRKLKEIVDCQNDDKQTPLHCLLFWNCNNPDLFEIFRYFLCECKADITIKNSNEWNILFYVCCYGSFQMIVLILKERDCSKIINDQDEWGDVAFSLLIRNNSIEEAHKIELFNLFLKYGLHINLKNKNNKTMLDVAKILNLKTLTERITKYLKEPSYGSERPKLNVWWRLWQSVKELINRLFGIFSGRNAAIRE